MVRWDWGLLFSGNPLVGITPAIRSPVASRTAFPLSRLPKLENNHDDQFITQYNEAIFDTDRDRALQVVHEAEVTFESEPGQGTTFIIRLPIGPG